MKKIKGAFLFFILLSVLNSCDILGDGSNKLIKETANNKHTKKAVLFLREGGATVGNSYQVSITDYDTEFDTTAIGNVFTVDGDHGKVFLAPKVVNFNWLSDDTIEISYDKNLRKFIQKQAIDGTTITYIAK